MRAISGSPLFAKRSIWGRSASASRAARALAATAAAPPPGLDELEHDRRGDVGSAGLVREAHRQRRLGEGVLLGRQPLGGHRPQCAGRGPRGRRPAPPPDRRDRAACAPGWGRGWRCPTRPRHDRRHRPRQSTCAGWRRGPARNHRAAPRGVTLARAACRRVPGASSARPSASRASSPGQVPRAYAAALACRGAFSCFSRRATAAGVRSDQDHRREGSGRCWRRPWPGASRARAEARACARWAAARARPRQRRGFQSSAARARPASGARATTKMCVAATTSGVSFLCFESHSRASSTVSKSPRRVSASAALLQVGRAVLDPAAQRGERTLIAQRFQRVDQRAGGRPAGQTIGSRLRGGWATTARAADAAMGPS